MESGQLFPNAAGPFPHSAHLPRGEGATCLVGLSGLAAPASSLSVRKGHFLMPCIGQGKLSGAWHPFWKHGKPFLYLSELHEISQMGDGDPISAIDLRQVNVPLQTGSPKTLSRRRE